MRLSSFPNDRQLDMMDCGPATLKMIAKYYGKFYSLQYLRDKCGISKEGVSFLDISHAAEEIGLRTHSIKCTVEDLVLKVPLPAIIHWNNSHFVIVYKVNNIKEVAKEKRNDDLPIDAMVYVSDPARGHVKYNIKEFSEKWIKGDSKKGVLMALEPQAEFYQKEANEKIERKKTLENFLSYFTLYKKSFINLFIVMLLVTILQGFLPFISKAVIDVGIQTQDIDFVNIVLIANISIVLSVLLSNLVRDWIMLHITARVNVALISDYLIKLMRLPITFFENKMAGDILQRAQDHERIRSFLMDNSLNMIFSTLTFLVFAVIMLSTTL